MMFKVKVSYQDIKQIIEIDNYEHLLIVNFCRKSSNQNFKNLYLLLCSVLQEKSYFEEIYHYL